MTANEYMKSIQDNFDGIEKNLDKLSKEEIDIMLNALAEGEDFPEEQFTNLEGTIETVLHSIIDDDDYSIGQRNVLRWVLWCIRGGEEPKYEKPVTGKWIENGKSFICSECGDFALKVETGCLVNRHYEPYLSKYCPNCGAKMEVKE